MIRLTSWCSEWIVGAWFDLVRAVDGVVRTNRDHIECVGCGCGGSNHVVVDGLVIDGSALTFWNPAAWVSGVGHKGAVRWQARVYSASAQPKTKRISDSENAHKIQANRYKYKEWTSIFLRCLEIVFFAYQYTEFI